MPHDDASRVEVTFTPDFKKTNYAGLPRHFHRAGTVHRRLGEWIDRLETEVSSTEFDRLCNEWDRRTEEFLTTVTKPAELHLFADQWNWDCGGLTEMALVLSLPVCERATALLIFWRAQPEDFQYYGRADEAPEYSRDTYEFVREIERLYLDGAFAEGSLQYDPRSDYILAGPLGASSHTKWKISSIMYDPVGMM